MKPKLQMIKAEDGIIKCGDLFTHEAYVPHLKWPYVAQKLGYSKYALGKTSGKANIEKNLQELGLQLNDEDLKKVTLRIIELGDQKELVTKEDLPYIISDVLDSNLYEEKVTIESYVLTHSKGLKPSTTVALTIDGAYFQEHAQGDGQFDAFMNAIKKNIR